MTRVELLRGAALERYWPAISEQLDTIPETWRLWWTKELLYNQALLGHVQVWGAGPEDAIKMIVFTKVMCYVPAKILSLFLAFGNSLDEFIPALDATLTRFAMDAECDFIEVTGRNGWERKLPNFKRLNSTFIREVRKEGVH